MNIPGWIEARGEPILNPLTSETHRARINLLNGFEYDICKVGRGWAETQGPLKLSIPNSHSLPDCISLKVALSIRCDG